MYFLRKSLMRMRKLHFKIDSNTHFAQVNLEMNLLSNLRITQSWRFVASEYMSILRQFPLVSLAKSFLLRGRFIGELEKQFGYSVLFVVSSSRNDDPSRLSRRSWMSCADYPNVVAWELESKENSRGWRLSKRSNWCKAMKVLTLEGKED